MEFVTTTQLPTGPHPHPSSCLITTLAETLTSDATAAVELTDRDRLGLVDVLGDVPDPRDPRGIRYRLASLLAVAVCAVVAGAVTYAAIADWLEDLPEADLPALCLTRRPAGTTLWRLLIRIDSIVLTRVLAGWLLTRLPPADLAPGDQPPASTRRAIAFDGKTIRGSAPPDGTCTHLLSAYDIATGITLAQIPVQAKGGEIAQVTPLVDQIEAVIGPVAGTVFLADALHAQTIHTQDLTARGAALLVRVKANQPGLFDRLRALPWPAVPVGDRTRDRGHGRRETRTCKAVTVAVPGGLGFPHAAQAVRITRTRRIPDATTTPIGDPKPKTFKTRRETAYLIITLPHDQASPVDLNLWARQEWIIENKSHHVRDMTLREDEQRARTGNGPAVFAALRNAAIGYHHTNGAPNIARATRRADRHSSDLIRAVTSTRTTTQ
jgi:predicted transposase YbfD/YdcC